MTRINGRGEGTFCHKHLPVSRAGSVWAVALSVCPSDFRASDLFPGWEGAGNVRPTSTRRAETRSAMAKKKQPKVHPNPTFDKSKMPSRHTTVGPERAPHRSYLYAMGLNEKQINQPIVGVATCW